MNYKNVRFKWGNGKFVESAKQLKDGFEKVEYTDPRTKKNEVTYHKFYGEVEGTISSVGINETTFGTFLRVNVKTGDNEITSIQVSLEDDYGYSRETKAFISSLRGYEPGEPVTIRPVVKDFTRKNGKAGKDINFYFNYVNKKDSEGKSETTGYIAFSELPPLDKEEKRGKTVYNNEKQMDFYYQILEGVIAKMAKYWEEVKSKNTSTTPENSTPSEDRTSGVLEPNAEFDEDDLPF